MERSNPISVVLPEALDDPIRALQRRRGFRVHGPAVHDGAIVYDELEAELSGDGGDA